VTVPTQGAEDALAALNADPAVVYAEPDELRSALAPPDDPWWPFMWGLANTGQEPFAGTPGSDINLLDAWSFSQGAGQTVAVVDSGVDLAHDDLVGQVAAGGRNFVQGTGPNDLSDTFGHGTHVAGTIAARANNGLGVVGVAPFAKVLPLRVLDSQGQGFDSWVAQAFDYAGDLGLRVVNASLGGERDSQTLAGAIAAHPNTLYVVPAGNGGTDGIGDNNDARRVLPCNLSYANVVCVGATDEDDRRAPFSNYGAASVDLFAPGVDIVSTSPADQYGFQYGTSMATPHVSGEAALLLAAAPSLSSHELKDLILGTVDRRPGLSGFSVSGGRANAGAALRRLVGAGPDRSGMGLPSNPCPAIPGPAADGCPVIAPPPTAVPPQESPPASGGTARGAPPRVRSLDVRVRPKRCRQPRACTRTARVAITGDHPATGRVTIELQRCGARRCRWVSLARRSVAIAAGKASVTVRSRRFVRGSYRATAVLSSSLGSGTPVRHFFRIR
jgi:thermitase